MTKTTKIWIWIAVAVIVIAGLVVGGFFLLKKDNNNDGGNGGNGENADFTPNGSNGTNKNSGSNSNSNNTTTNDEQTNSTVDANAAKLYNAIDGIGTTQKDIYEVFKNVQSIEEIKLILEKYESLYGSTFEMDLHQEWLGGSTLESINGILKNKGFDAQIGWRKSETTGIY